MQLDKLGNFELFLIILTALLMGIGGTFLDKDKVTRFSLKSPILYQCSVTALVFIGLFLALAIVRSVLWDIIPIFLFYLFWLGSLWMQSYLFYEAFKSKKLSTLISSTFYSIPPSIFGAVFFWMTLGDLFNVDLTKNLIIYPAISTLITFAISYLLHKAKKRTKSEFLNIETPQNTGPTENSFHSITCDLSIDGNDATNVKSSLTQEEFWSEWKKRRLTQDSLSTPLSKATSLKAMEYPVSQELDGGVVTYIENIIKNSNIQVKFDGEEWDKFYIYIPINYIEFNSSIRSNVDKFNFFISKLDLRIFKGDFEQPETKLDIDNSMYPKRFLFSSDMKYLYEWPQFIAVA